MTCGPFRSRILLPAPRPSPDDQSQPVPLTTEDAIRRYAYRYQAPVPIRPAPKRPLYLSVLKPKPGASTIPLGEASPHLLAVEQRVGRGRITMLAINPNEESLLAWPGLDTLVRRVVLRRPEEPIVVEGDYGRPVPRAATARPLARHGPELVSNHESRRGPGHGAIDGASAGPRRERPRSRMVAGTDPETAENEFNRQTGVADWRDGAKLPRLVETCSKRLRASRSPARISSCGSSWPI